MDCRKDSTVNLNPTPLDLARKEKGGTEEERDGDEENLESGWGVHLQLNSPSSHGRLSALADSM